MIESLPGFREFYPDACFRRQYLFNTWRSVVRRFNFEEYDGPVLEPLELYTRKSGEEIVEQLFAFTDKGGREVALRPEMTPTLARLIGARAQSLKRPIKWFTVAENFRYERPSRGRLRSHFQLNADIYGEAGIGAEAELLTLLATLFDALGLTGEEVTIRLSDRDLWLYFLQTQGVEESQCLPVLSVIDKKERTGEEDSLKALKEVVGEQADSLWRVIGKMTEIRDLDGLQKLLDLGDAEAGGDIRNRVETWRQLFAILESQGVSEFIQMDLSIVRGLAYYTGFVFEAFEASGEGRALAGGGRYDELVEKLGGPAMPAVGFGFGDVMIELVLESLGKMPVYKPAVDVYAVFSRGEAEMRLVFPVVGRLRQAGYRVEYPLKASGFGKQFREANQKQARIVLICGLEEAEQDMVKVKSMAGGEEVSLPAGEVVDWVQQQL